MLMKNKKLIIIGAGEFAEIAYEYFTYDSDYEVLAFAVEKKYKKAEVLYELPVIEFEEMHTMFPPKDVEVFVAITYVQLNRARTRLFNMCKELGYSCASYVSSHSFVWRNAHLGENVFVFENCTLQHHVCIGNNVIIWSGSYIGHRSVVEDNCWIAPQNAIAGFCHVGCNCFIGTNATMGDNVSIAKDTILGAGAITVKDIKDEGGIYVGNPVRKLERTSYQRFGVENL